MEKVGPRLPGKEKLPEIGWEASEKGDGAVHRSVSKN